MNLLYVEYFGLVTTAIGTVANVFILKHILRELRRMRYHHHEARYYEMLQ